MQTAAMLLTVSKVDIRGRSSACRRPAHAAVVPGSSRSPPACSRCDAAGWRAAAGALGEEWRPKPGAGLAQPRRPGKAVAACLEIFFYLLFIFFFYNVALRHRPAGRRATG